MPPSKEESAHNIANLSRSSSKRELSGAFLSSKIQSPFSTSDQHDYRPTSPSAKRLKTSHSAGNLGRSADMMNRVSGKGVEQRAQPPTTSNYFQPHTGAKRLVIKNLRTTSRKDADAYYDRTWQELDDALTTIFNRKPPSSPLEVLCRGVEMTCRRGRSEPLFTHLKDRCKVYIEKTLLPIIEKQSGLDPVETLRVVHKYWTVWNEQSTLIRSIFSYLDRSYLLNTKDLPQLEDLSITQFRHAVFSKGKTAQGQRLGDRVVAGMCELVDLDRKRQEDLFDPSLLKDSIAMLHIFGIYGKSFEPKFLEQSEQYFETYVSEHSTSGMKDYIWACNRVLSREGLRCDTYNFDSTTKRLLLDSAHDILIKQRSNILLDASGLGKLIETNEIGSLTVLYSLLALAKTEKELKEPFETYIKIAGAAIVGDKDKVDDMVIHLLELKRSLDIIIRDAFGKDDTFIYSLREAFGNFINDKKNTTAWGTNTSKVGEMIAKYMDMLLRGGLKAVPRSLASDAKDRDAAEKQGQASTGDEDAELDRQLEQALELFRFIEGKDVFEAFYKKDLARRLLMARSASQDAERNMLAKLKLECGSSFTHNLEHMFKDQELAREEMISFKEATGASKSSLDLQVNVLSAAAWPTYPDVQVNIPPEVAKHIERYDRHYKHKHTGRILTWKHALAHSVIRAQFTKGPKELLVSAFQAIVLVLFNDIPSTSPLSYTTIQSSTSLSDPELQRTLQSLACGKFRILTKHPKGREVKKEDTFTVNLGFTDPKYRIKINQIQLKETKEENKETHERVVRDRQYETQAAIVRIMKSRKSMGHGALVAEVIEQTRKRGAVEVGEIKRNIESLIEKDYIEREGSSYVYCA